MTTFSAPQAQPVIHQRDPDGSEVVGIPLTNAPGQHCWMDARTYEAFVATHGARAFYLNGAFGYLYVRCTPPGLERPLNVAKFVTGMIPHTAITYADSNRLNLRRSNLVVNRGGWGVAKKKSARANTSTLNTEKNVSCATR